MQRIVIINSRQSLRPTGSSSWVKACSVAIQTLMSEGEYIFLVSLGEVTYELTLALLSDAGATVEVILTSEQVRKFATDKRSFEQYLISEYRLIAPSILICDISGAKQSYKNSAEGPSHTRDSAILRLADILVPISVRPEGFWSERLASSDVGSKALDRRFEIQYTSKRTPLKQSFIGRRINSITEQRLQGYLAHWTRTANFPWPGESRWEFYLSLCQAQESYPRSAFATVRRILSEQRICGSSRHKAENIAMVSLTAASLSESVELMKYRTRYREMTFEPFAICLPIDTAKKAGALAIAYHTKDGYAKLELQSKLFAHSVVSEGANWAAEKEWRIKGELALGPIWQDIIVLSETEAQAQGIAKRFGVESLAVFE